VQMERLVVTVLLPLLRVLRSLVLAVVVAVLTKLEPQLAQEAQEAVESVELTLLLQMAVTELQILAQVVEAVVVTIRLLESHRVATAVQEL
jgi:hypothetical protein